jgi:hypothetical protein
VAHSCARRAPAADTACRHFPGAVWIADTRLGALFLRFQLFTLRVLDIDMRPHPRHFDADGK